MELTVGFPVYVMAIISFLGWIFFVFFGGLGLSALPIDLIMDFVNRPKIRKAVDVHANKEQLKKTTTQLIELGTLIKDEEKEAEKVEGFFKKRSAKSKTE